MTHYDNSGSEDGQLRSPGDTHFLSGGHKSATKADNDLVEDDTDSLDIKPPQAATIHRDTSGKRRSGKEKKHSKERKHKVDHREKEERRERGERSDSSTTMSATIAKYKGGEREIMVDDRRYMKHYERGRPMSHGQQRRDHHYDRGMMGDEYEYQNRHKHREVYHHHQPYQQGPHQRYDYHSQRNYIEPAPVYDARPEAELLEQDLRTRLLTKRHKYVKEYPGSHNHHDKRSNHEYYRERGESTTEKRKETVIEVMDSPEQQEVIRRKHKKKDKQRSPEDPELTARKAKLIEAEREMAKRKEVAREELEARRELRRERGEEPVKEKAHKSGHKRHKNAEEKALKKKKRKLDAGIAEADNISVNSDAYSHNGDNDGDGNAEDKEDVSDASSNKSEKIKKKHRRAKEDPEKFDVYSHNENDDKGDDGDDDDDDDDNDDDSDSDSDSSADSDVRSHKSFNGAAEKSKLKKQEPLLSEEEGALPDESPLSIGDLSKSPHKNKANNSRSRSGSVASSRSKSDSDLDHDDERRSRSRSRTRSRSPRSHSNSRSRSISGSSRSRSRSHTNSRSKSRSRSRSRSRSEERNMKTSAEEEARKGDPEVVLDDKDVPRNEKGEKLPNYFPGIQGCRSVEEFQCLNRIEEGTYGVVYRAKDKRTSEIVALKRLKMEKEKEGFPITSLREINTLLKGQHPNIVTVREIVVGSNMDRIFIVMDYVEHDLKSLMETMKHKEQSFFPGEIKCLIQQLLCAVGHLHDNWILHRDLKTSNLLLSHKGILKVGDFGLAREYGSPLKKYTSLVVTLWYRAPELLLCSPEYSTPIDIWSVGCIFGEFLQMQPLFPGKSEIDQLNRIFKELGTPNEKIWPGYKDLPAVKNLLSQNSQFTEYPVSNLRKRFMKKTTDVGISLLQALLTYDPKQRLNAEQALKHPYFKELPLPIDPSMFPTWPAKSELGARKALASSPKPPSGGSQFKQLGQDDIITTKSAGGRSGIVSGSKKATSSSTGFVLNAGMDQRQLAMGPGFSLKF